MPAYRPGYAAAMGQDRSDDAYGGPRLDLDEQVATRAEPLPEEAAAGDDGDRRDEAAEILRDSEERVAEAVAGDAPGDAAQEHRHSEDAV
jgi:hypothetical protein